MFQPSRPTLIFGPIQGESTQEGPVLSRILAAFALMVPVCASFEAVAAQAPAAAAAEAGKLEQVIPGHYVYSSGARLSGVIVTDEGVVVVDALSNEAMAKHERQLIAGVIGKPVRYLVSSTFHGNYSLGNVAYP